MYMHLSTSSLAQVSRCAFLSHHGWATAQRWYIVIWFLHVGVSSDCKCSCCICTLWTQYSMVDFDPHPNKVLTRWQALYQMHCVCPTSSICRSCDVCPTSSICRSCDVSPTSSICRSCDVSPTSSICRYTVCALPPPYVDHVMCPLPPPYVDTLCALPPPYVDALCVPYLLPM